MKPKKFELDKGKYPVVAIWTGHNDTTEEDDEHLIRTYEQAVLPVKEEAPTKQRGLPFKVLKRIRRGKPQVD